MAKAKKLDDNLQTDHGNKQNPRFQGVTRYKVSTFRENLKSILDEVHLGKRVLIDVRDTPYAFLIPADAPAAPMGEYEDQLACIISERLLKDAPMHILRPQIEELARLEREELFALMDIDKFPLPREVRKRVLAKLKNPEILKRLEKRRKIVDSILAAKRDGLYEASEHATGLQTFE